LLPTKQQLEQNKISQTGIHDTPAHQQQLESDQLDQTIIQKRRIETQNDANA